MHGKMTEGGHVDSSEWGTMHKDCHEDAVATPDSSLAKIRKLAKATTVVVSAKKAAKSA